MKLGRPLGASTISGSPSADLIRALGGGRIVAEACGLAITAVYRWTRAREDRRGGGGLIPSVYCERLRPLALGAGIDPQSRIFGGAFGSAPRRLELRRIIPGELPPDGACWVALPGGRAALVDDADYDLVAARDWIALDVKRANTIYAVTSTSRGRIAMHRLILGFPEQPIDHANRCGLDNRRSNLRLCTVSQNLANAPARGARSGFKGVGFNNGTWSARIAGSYIGNFGTPEEAAHVYDAAARAKYGEFARVNFPLPGEAAALNQPSI